MPRTIMCRFSIILRVYDSLDLLAKTIKSIEVQTSRDFEVIFVNDCSNQLVTSFVKEKTDNLKKIGINAMVIENKINYGSRGLYGSLMNIGIGQASGEYIMVLDSDDLLLSNAFEIINTFIANNPILDVLCNNMQILDNTKLTNYLYSDIHPFHWYAYDKKYLFIALLLQNFICHPGTIIRKKTLDLIGGYQSRFSCDHSLWLEMAIQDKNFCFNMEPIGIYRFHSNGSSTGLAKKNNVYNEILDIQRQYLAFLPYYLEYSKITKEEMAYIYDNSSWKILKQQFQNQALQ